MTPEMTSQAGNPRTRRGGANAGIRSPDFKEPTPMHPIRTALLLLATTYTLLGTGCVGLAVHAVRKGIENAPHPECAGYDAGRAAADALGSEAKRLKKAGRISVMAMLEAQQEGEIHELRLKSLCEAFRSNDITQQEYNDGLDKATAALRNARSDMEASRKQARAPGSGS